MPFHVAGNAAALLLLEMGSALWHTFFVLVGKRILRMNPTGKLMCIL